MHKGSMLRMEWFVENYIKGIDKNIRILDVGSYDVNGSYHQLFDGMTNIEYIGLDMEKGPNVNYVPEDPYNWSELEDGSFDFVISGNAFEHIEYPWLTIGEIYKKISKEGFACIIAPNSIGEHRYPVDCYRYFSDGFSALAKWAGFTVVNVTVGGIPNAMPSYEWFEYGYNDTMMIITKEKDPDKLSGLPVLPMEKRYSDYDRIGEKCQFLIDWINIKNKETVLHQYFAENGIKKVYLYGYGKIGSIIYEELRKIKDIELYVMDKNKNSTDEVNVIHVGERIDEAESSCMVSSLLNRGILDELDKIYPNIKKINIDELI